MIIVFEGYEKQKIHVAKISHYADVCSIVFDKNTRVIVKISKFLLKSTNENNTF